MKRTIQPTFSGNVLNFHLPTSWLKLSQDQLKYVFYLLSHFDIGKVKTYAFIRFCDITVVKKNKSGWTCHTMVGTEKVCFKLDMFQVYYFTDKLNYLEACPDLPVCLNVIDGMKAVNVQLHDVSFGDYLQLENLYQGYLITNKPDTLNEIGKLLYLRKGKHPNKLSLSEAEQLSIFMWYTSVKNLFAKLWPHFFDSADLTNDEFELPNMLDCMNAQIRALTQGDVTKEKIILEMDCWRALTELNEKACEAKELNRKHGRN